MAEIQYSFARYEKKYFLTPQQQAAVLEGLRPYTQPDEYGSYSICNLYYDTDDWRLIRASIEKPTYKEKLRVRSYGIPEPDGTVFVEIKKKCRGMVYKRRICADVRLAAKDLPRAAALQGGQIGREIGWFLHTYPVSPKVFIAYDRTAFAGLDDPSLRITFDRNIRWRDTALDLRQGSTGTPLGPEGKVLMELKLPGVCPLWLSRLLSEVGAFPTSFSKYGAYYCEHIVKEIPKEARYSA